MREVLIIDDNQSSSELERFLRNRGFSVIVVDAVYRTDQAFHLGELLTYRVAEQKCEWSDTHCPPRFESII